MHHLDRAVQIASEPAKVGGAGVGLVERLEIDHLLIGGRRLRDPSLFHQHVAKQAEVEDEFPRRDELPRDLLRLGETMHLVKHVPAKQERGWVVRLDRVETRGRLLGHLVEAGIVREAGLGDEAVSELFSGAGWGAFLAQVLLERWRCSCRCQDSRRARPGMQD